MNSTSTLLNAEAVGHCDTSDGSVKICAPGGIEKILLPGGKLRVGDKTLTGADGSVSLNFDDGTKIVAGAHSILLIDAFAIEATNDAGIHFTLANGTFVIESGNLASGPDGFVIEAGDTALCLRSARIAVRVDPLGYDLVSLLPSRRGPIGEVLAFNKIASQVLDHAYQTLRLGGEGDDIQAPLTLPSGVVRETYAAPDLEQTLFPDCPDGAEIDYSEVFQPFQTLPDRFLERQFISRQVFPNDGPMISGEGDRFLEDAFEGTRFRLCDPESETTV